MLQTQKPFVTKTSIQLRLVNELNVRFQSLLSTENVYEEIVGVVQNKFHFYSFSIWSVSRDSTASLQAISGAYNKYIQPGFSIRGEGIVGTVIQTKKTYLCNDVSKDPHFTNLSLPIKTKSQLSIPVLAEGQVVAVLTVESSSKNAFDEEDIVTFEAVGALLSVTFVNMNLYNEIRSFNKRLQVTVEERTHELQRAHERILEQQKLLQKENKVLRNLVTNDKKDHIAIIGQSPAIQSLMAMVDKIAPTHATVLIQGESGTGKELIARRLHFKSVRNSKPYVTINCGALQENLLESELFGHEKGSFTGAITQKMGLVETADGGTLFLDEIAEMSLGIQAKLLRFLQEGEIYRVGGKKPIRVNVRIISASNRDLEFEIREGKFREDLFYRLNTITLRMPPLRKRGEDIRLLVDYFLKNPKFGGPVAIKNVEQRVYEMFENYDWPGNIRELQNTLERLKILANNNEIRMEDLPLHIRVPKPRREKRGSVSFDVSLDMTLEQLEKQHIMRILTFHQGNKTKTADTLGITIKTLYNKLHRYGLLTDAGGLYPQ